MSNKYVMASRGYIMIYQVAAAAAAAGIVFYVCMYVSFFAFFTTTFSSWIYRINNATQAGLNQISRVKVRHTKKDMDLTQVSSVQVVHVLYTALQITSKLGTDKIFFL